MPKKKKFVVLEDETIEECLARMKKEGYRPVRRMERPIFKQNEEGKTEPEYYRQSITFEGIKE